ncbi:hypothetical protein M2404_001139 [Rheinheimera pacifica]|uniref:hypothetical protein n=1 Tax=Rheinheimera pacifica TaxID=173990 RepID=UPI0021676080|nr:hypothetical protein [Rheinheimera pacifica]MCS4306814.1 hypothetical protein [Rheinheimera pacifica]
MLRIYHIYIIVCLATLSLSVSATEVRGTTIKSLWVNDSSNNVIFVEPTNSFESACGLPQGQYFILEPDLPNMKEVYSMLLAAMMSGRQVTIGGKGECFKYHEKMRYVYLSE